MKELPYFKFFPAEWIKGDITLCSMEAQGLFINICCYYWMRGCNIGLTGVQQRFNTCSTAINELIESDIITIEGDDISINYLNEQFDEFAKLSKVKSRAGQASARARKVNTCSTGVQQVLNKRDKKREDKKREDKNIPAPTWNEFLEYALIKKANIDQGKLKFKYEAWVENGWKDGNDKQIKNWKSKLLNTLPFIPEQEKQSAWDIEKEDQSNFNE